MSRIIERINTLIDIKGDLGFAKKSVTSFSSPMRGIESGNSRLKNVMRSSFVFKADIMDSGINKVHVNDLSCDQKSAREREKVTLFGRAISIKFPLGQIWSLSGIILYPSHSVGASAAGISSSHHMQSI